MRSSKSMSLLLCSFGALLLLPSHVVTFQHHSTTRIPPHRRGAGISTVRKQAIQLLQQQQHRLPVTCVWSSVQVDSKEETKNRRFIRLARVRVGRMFQWVQNRCSSLHNNLPNSKNNNLMKEKRKNLLQKSVDLKNVMMTKTSLWLQQTKGANETVLSYANEEDLVDESISSSKQYAVPVSSNVLSSMMRSTVPANTTDLSGKWKIIITPEFKQAYDQYLQNITSPAWFRRVMLPTLGLLEDHIEQDGTKFTMTSKNPAGSWTRTLISSCDIEPLDIEITDPDSDKVKVESWWENDGTVHRSLLKGKPRVKGGIFETLRYLEDDDTLITESIFHPPQHIHAMTTTNGTSTALLGAMKSNNKLKPAYVKWKFQRIR